MIPIKALLTGLVGTSLCTANISGTVTDTGATPIAGVVVQLEKNGTSATTGPDGRFMIVVTSTANIPCNSTPLPNSLSAKMTGNMLSVTISERSCVEVAIFDLTGKALLTEHKTIGPGRHSLLLPCLGTGIYMFKVKVNNREFFVKGNSISGSFLTSSLSAQVPSTTNTLTRKATNTDAKNDFIFASKEGLLNYRVMTTKFDTSGIVIKMISNAGNVTDADGNVYQSVKIGNQVWTIENLRTTKYNDGSIIPIVKDSLAWCHIYNSNLLTPAYCYYNNTTNADSIQKFGALYNWYAVETKLLSPEGWHIPTAAEWDTLQNFLITKGYNWDATTTGNKIAKSLATQTDWGISTTIGTIGCNLAINNNSGFSAYPGGCRVSFSAVFGGQSYDGHWWSATELDASDAYGCSLFYANDNFCKNEIDKRDGFSVRLLRN